MTGVPEGGSTYKDNTATAEGGREAREISNNLVIGGEESSPDDDIFNCHNGDGEAIGEESCIGVIPTLIRFCFS